MKHFDYITAAKGLLTHEPQRCYPPSTKPKVAKAYRLQSGLIC